MSRLTSTKQKENTATDWRNTTAQNRRNHRRERELAGCKDFRLLRIEDVNAGNGLDKQQKSGTNGDVDQKSQPFSRIG